MRYLSPYITSLLIWFFLLISSLFALVQLDYVTLLVALLISLNLATFLLYGLDKLFAMSRTRRIPERVLWFAAFAGAPIGALVGMHVFRHKVSKTSFQFGLAAVLLVEIAIVLYVVDI